MSYQDKLSKLVCEALQNTNEKCHTICNKKGSCYFCKTIAAHIVKNTTECPKGCPGTASVYDL